MEHPRNALRGRKTCVAGGNTFKGNKKGGGRPTTYHYVIDEAILTWLFEMIDPYHFFLLSNSLKRKLNHTIKTSWEAQVGCETFMYVKN